MTATFIENVMYELVSGRSTWKRPVRLVATTNQTLSGLPVIDSVQTLAGDEVLCVGQTNGAQNLIYKLPDTATGAWVPRIDFDSSDEILPQTWVSVLEGTTKAESVYRLRAPTSGIVYGVTSLSWVQLGVGGTVTNVTGSAPITSTGGNTPAIGITAATSGAAGSMSAADKAKLDAATTSATADTLALRNGSGACSFFGITCGAGGVDTPLVQIGATAASGGAINLKNADKIRTKTAGGTSVDLLALDAADKIQVGQNTGIAAVEMRVATGGAHVVYVNGVEQWRADASASLIAPSTAYVKGPAAQLEATGSIVVIQSNTETYFNSGTQTWYWRQGGTLRGETRFSQVQTTDATATTIATIAIPDNTTVQIIARVKGDQNGGASSAGYVVAATVKRAGGVATMVGAPNQLSVHEDVGAWDATIDVDGGNNARVRVTGAAATTIDWQCHSEIDW